MTLLSPLTDAAAVRRALSQYPSGISALAAQIGDLPIGLVASTFTVGVSLDPPLALFAVQNSSTTWPNLRRANHIGVSVLGTTHDRACQQLASRDGDRFAGLSTVVTSRGAVLLTDAPIWLECSIEREIPAGDHQVVLLRIEELRVEPEIDPLVFHRSGFRQLAPAV